MNSATQQEGMSDRFEQAKADGTELGAKAATELGERYHGEADCAAVFVTMVLAALLGAAIGELGADDAFLIWDAVGERVRAADLLSKKSTKH